MCVCVCGWVCVGVRVCEEKNVIFQHRTLTVWTSPSIQPISLSLALSLSPSFSPFTLSQSLSLSLSLKHTLSPSRVGKQSGIE